MLSVLVDLTRRTYINPRARGMGRRLEFVTSYIRPGRERQSMSLSEPRPGHVRGRKAGVIDKCAEPFWMVLEVSKHSFALRDSLDNFSFHSFIQIFSILPQGVFLQDRNHKLLEIIKCVSKKTNV